jgi:hypothetical protein
MEVSLLSISIYYSIHSINLNCTFYLDLYVDTDRKVYEALNFQVFSYFDLMKMMLSMKWINMFKKGKELNVGGDMKGDGFQNGINKRSKNNRF